MELSSFKAVLLRKAQGNDSLQTLIKSINDERFVDVVIEVLEKMPRATASTGSRASGPIIAFGANAGALDVNMMRDALGHHLSHYKAALKAHHAAPEGSPEKTKFRQVADAHMDHLFPIMHLAARAAAHSRNSKNAFDLDYPKIAPWETNYTKLTRNAKGNGPLRDPKLLRVRTKNSGSISKNTKDWGFLEMPPHPGHEDNATMPHTGGYPWEEIQLGKPADIDAKKAYIHIEDDVPFKGEYTPHEFDHHPIREIQDAQNEHLSEARLQKYATDLAAWHGGEHQKNWINRMRTLPPGEFAARGSKKASHFYEGMPLRPHEPHVHEHPVVQKKNLASAAAPAVVSQAPGIAAPTMKPTGAAIPAMKPTDVAAAPTMKPADAATSAMKPPSLAPTSAVKPVIRPAGKNKAEQERLDAQKTVELVNSAHPELKERLMALPGIQDLFSKIKGK